MTSSEITTLSNDEMVLLDELVAVVDRTITSFIECGTALAAIRDNKLYRETHSTFEAFVLERWEMTARRARQLMGAASIVAELPSGTAVPLTERHARELMPLRDDPEQMAEALAIAQTLHGKLTGDTIAEAVDYIGRRRHTVAGCVEWLPFVDPAEWHHIVAVQMAAEVRYNEQTLLPEPPWWSPGLCMAGDTWAALVRSASPKWNGKIHELCAALPPLAADELAALADSIARHGLIFEGTLLPDGTMLDGRMRQLACVIAGVPMRWKTYDGADHAELWHSLNFIRQHITDDQRAMIAVNLLEMGAEL